MVRKYPKKLGNPYMKRSRLSEPQFVGIASGYLALLTATELEKYVRENAAKLFKGWDAKTPPISRNTINKVYTKLDDRISILVEAGVFKDFPYSLASITDPAERDSEINKVISQIYLLLTSKISKERLKEIHDIWREQGQGFLFDKTIWQGTEMMWKKMSGLDQKGLRRMFNRVAFACYVIDVYKETSAIEASNASLGFLLKHLKEKPLE